MSDYSKLPPLAVSLGGFAFNGEHIEYWKAQATKADREIASLRAQLAESQKEEARMHAAVIDSGAYLKKLRAQLAEAEERNIQWARGNVVNQREKAALEVQLANARKALEEIADHPESKGPTPSDQSSYAVGWAFWNVKRIAKAALTDEQHKQEK